MDLEDLGGGYSAPGSRQGDADTDEKYTEDGRTICYRIHGNGATKLLLIPGLACGHAFWGPFIQELTSTTSASADKQMNHGEASTLQDADVSPQGNIQLCTFDNRGVGGSSVPTRMSEYSTTIMANDALALMDFLGWKRAHVCGHSMGAMIGLKLAALAPDRVGSLTLISVTGGGFQCLPKFEWRSVSIAYRFLRAKTLEDRILVDLDTHYTQDYLDETVEDVPRKHLLYKEYLKNMEAGGMQPQVGLNGHINACWTHKLDQSEMVQIRSSGFPVAVIHGKDDVIAQIHHATNLARKLGSCAKVYDLPGGHLVTHQNTKEVLRIILDVIHTSTQPCNSNKNHDEEEETGTFWSFIRGCMCLFIMFCSLLTHSFYFL